MERYSGAASVDVASCSVQQEGVISEAGGVGLKPGLDAARTERSGAFSLSNGFQGGNLPDLASDLGKTAAKVGGSVNGVLNRSHDSIESQRTVIEADDFASFLAQEDGEEAGDFGDEDVDVGDDGDVDLSVLMKGGHNPYVLDFTSTTLGESEGGDEDDCTLSDTEWDAVVGNKSFIIRGHRNTTEVNGISRGSTESWVNQTAAARKSGEEKAQEEEKPEDDEEFESPPRNLREEINNNVNKFPLLPSAMSPGIYPGGSAFSSYSAVLSDSEVGHMGVPKYLLRGSSGSTPPSSPQTLKQPTFFTGPRIVPSTAPEPPPRSTELVHEFEPDSQSSPILWRSFREDLRNHEPGQNRVGHFEGKTMHPTSDTRSPHVRSRHGSLDNLRSFPSSPPPHLRNSTFEAPLGHSSFISSSLENLTSSPTADYSLAKSFPLNHVFDNDSQESWPLSRGKSLPDIANLATGPFPGLCKNCGFSRNDYLFKIR